MIWSKPKSGVENFKILVLHITQYFCKIFDIIDFRDFVKFLVEVGGASTTIADILGQTPAIFAKKKCKMQIMTYLNSV